MYIRRCTASNTQQHQQKLLLMVRCRQEFGFIYVLLVVLDFRLFTKVCAKRSTAVEAVRVQPLLLLQ